MRHMRAGYRLGRTSSHRRATLRNLAASLFEHGQITTTVPRAKAVQPMVEKIITLAKRNDLHARRLVAAKLGYDRPSFEWLLLPPKPTEGEKATKQKMVERATRFFDIPDESMVKRNRYGELVKAPKLVKHIFDHVAPRFKDRPGGYTRIIKLSTHKIGDGSPLCVLQLVGAEEGPEIGGRVSKRRRIADKRTAFAAKVRKAAESKA